MLRAAPVRSGLGAQDKAAGAPESGETEAPSGSSIVNGEKNMDTASSTPPAEIQQATSSPGLAPSPVPQIEPANDNAPLPDLQATGAE